MCRMAVRYPHIGGAKVSEDGSLPSHLHIIMSVPFFLALFRAQFSPSPRMPTPTNASREIYPLPSHWAQKEEIRESISNSRMEI